MSDSRRSRQVHNVFKEKARPNKAGFFVLLGIVSPKRHNVLTAGTLMTYQELVRTIQTLPLAERLSLLEVLAQSLQADMQVEGERRSSLDRVRGILKTDDPAPSDQEIEEDYTSYLIEKYA